MPLDPEAIAALVRANAAALDLPIAPAHLPGVQRYVALAAEMAELVNGLPLTRDDESGSVFVPVSPPDAPCPET